jgi:hypothetical protein
MPLYNVTIKNNYTAIIAPTITDDSDFGYSNGSVWVDTITHNAYICASPSIGAAVWELM